MRVHEGRCDCAAALFFDSVVEDIRLDGVDDVAYYNLLDTVLFLLQPNLVADFLKRSLGFFDQLRVHSAGDSDARRVSQVTSLIKRVPEGDTEFVDIALFGQL